LLKQLLDPERTTMAIKRVTADTPILANQYVCFESMMRDAICTQPYSVEKVSGQRIYYTNRHGEDEGYKLRKNVVFVCDTLAEGDFLRDVSQAQLYAIDAATTAVKAEHTKKIDALIASAS